MTGLFRLDARPVDADAFRLAAIDPSVSVVVDACAGSGKTTLLVARIVRALLEGVEPDQVLAITFTRLAAHEMHERLVGELRGLALADDAALHERLAGWFGLGEGRADALAGRARGLYEAVLSHPRGPEITTFHSWFRTLASLGPLADEAGEGSQLTEESAALLQQAWFEWLDALSEPDRAGLRADFESLVNAIGLSGTRRCLESLVDQRTDWAVGLEVAPGADAAALRAAAARAAEGYRDCWCEAATRFAREGGPLPADVPDDAVMSGTALLGALARDAALHEALAFFAPLLGRGSVDLQRMGMRLVGLVPAEPDDAAGTILWLEELADIVLTSTGTVRKWRSSKSWSEALESAGGAQAVTARWEAFGARIGGARALLAEWQGVGLNAAMMRCGADLLGAFRRLKREQGVIDFADLESIAYRLLRDPETAAYLQCRLDRRYRHLLFDEFQDTSSLQWRVIADWLQSYAGAGERPSVFVVGDPKQSIYRFRRAEARVFEAAKALLREGFDAREAGTDTTRRNAPAVVDVLNRCLPGVMPHYREQATTVDACRGVFWRLPLVSPDEGGDAEAARDTATHGDADAAAAAAGALPGAPASRDGFDWLETPREDEASLRHLEGLRIADAIAAARAELERQGRPVAWGGIFVLARSRTGFESYERALRERGMPVRSDRAGGLLQSLEGDDLRALLAFVRRPADDLALAQVLASPLVGLDAPAIGWIAARGSAASMPSEGEPDAEGEPESQGEPAGADEARREGRMALPRRWWPRLRALVSAPDPADPPPFDLPALVERLAGWIDAAARAPVHDFLDAALAQADAFARYPQAVAPAQREVAHANLCAMLGLALDVDAGRFPSLAGFLRRLRGYDTLEDREGPSEGRGDAVDAIRLMTIHASKGLEADLVVLADAHQRGQPDGQRLHVDWAPELPRPAHLSFVLDASLAGTSRRRFFERDAELREREDRNLLYVALTRARYGVIVSGVRTRNAPRSSWYTFLDGVPPPGADAAGLVTEAAAEHAAAPGVVAAVPGWGADDAFDLRLLALKPLQVGARRDPSDQGRGDEGPADTLLALERGHALHRALELLPAGHDDATVLAALHAYALDDAQRRAALDRARSVLALEALAPAFAEGAAAVCEFEILAADGQPRRIDRLARVGNEAWVIDYKWSVDPTRRIDYVAQLAAYRMLVAELDPPALGASGPIRTVLVDASAGRVDFDVDL